MDETHQTPSSLRSLWTLWSLLEVAAAERPDDCFALDQQGRTLSFADAHQQALGMAGALRDVGVRPGIVVSWQLTNRLETLVLMLSLSHMRAIQNPLLHSLRDREVTFICTQMKTTVLVTSVAEPLAAVAQAVGEALPDLVVVTVDQLVETAGAVAPNVTRTAADRWGDGTSLCFYTSGTTAEPKGVRHSDGSVIAAARGLVDALRLSSTDRVPLVFPVAHVGGAIHCARALLTGGPILLSSDPKPTSLIPFLRRSAATVVPGSPPFIAAYFDHVAHHPQEVPLFPAARLMNHGGSPKPPQLHAEVRARLGTAGIISGYGLTECPMAVFNTPGDADDLLATTEGRPTGGAEIRIQRPDSSPAQSGGDGEILIRGPQLMLGYVDASLDAAAFTSDGFLRTGDLGTIDAAGYLRVTGRLKDVIIRNMENISAREIEDLLATHPFVGNVAVVGLPDPRTGERVCAVVVPADPNSPPSLTELLDHLRAGGLSTYKLPEQLEIMNELPTGLLNKVNKRDLVQRFTRAL